MLRRASTAAAAIVMAVALAGCGLQVPTDPNGTLNRIQGSVLRAGASVDAGLVDVDDSAVSGPLPDLVNAFADRYDADVEWTVGSEESLVTALEKGSLDIVVGGITAETPWADRAGVTRGYLNIPGAGGREIVLLVPLGENRLLSELELVLDEELSP